jgi:hypothetical protein
MVPLLIIVGADKGGVGKTTVSRALLDYLQVNNKFSATRAFDTEPEPGVLKRFFPDKTGVVDLTQSDGQMHVFDSMKTSLITLIDTKAGILSTTLQTLDDIGYLQKAADGLLKLAVVHVLGGTMSSFREIKSTAEKLTNARHFLIKNQINDNSFFKWNAEMSQFLAGGVIDVPKLDALAGEHVDIASIGFEKFAADETKSETLRGYVKHWLRRVYTSFDAAGLNGL